MTGGGFDVVTVAEEKLLVRSASGGSEKTFTLLVMVVPFASSQVTAATICIVVLPPPGICGNVMVRMFPSPAQIPPAFAEQLTNVVPAGNRSATTTDIAGSGRSLFTVIVYVTFDPVNTGLGKAVCVIVRSGATTAR